MFSLIAIGALSHMDWHLIACFPGLSPVGFLALCLIGLDSYMPAVLGWAYYVALTWWSLISGRRRRFFALYIVLCISLIVNIAGCDLVMHAKT